MQSSLRDDPSKELAATRNTPDEVQTPGVATPKPDKHSESKWDGDVQELRDPGSLPEGTDSDMDTRPDDPGTNAHGTDAFRLYLREIGPIKLLTADEEIDLARRVQRGDAQAREQMITANLKLVVKIARDFEGAGVPLLDLIAEGNLGLMKAVERFDPDRGTRLASYAAFWIKQHIRRAISNQSRTVRLPVHIHDRLWQISRATLRLRALLGRPPSDEEIADAIQIPVAKVGRLLESAQGTVSLDASLGDEDSEALGAIIADENATRPDEQLDDAQSRGLLEGCLQALNPREKAVLQERFGLDGRDDHTLEEVGDKFGLTRERIRQIQNRALGKLRLKLLARSARSVAA